MERSILQRAVVARTPLTTPGIFARPFLTLGNTMTFVRSVFLLLATALSVGAQSRLTVKVDSRIELMAVT